LSPSPDAEGLLDLDTEGRAHIPIPRRLDPALLAGALLAVAEQLEAQARRPLAPRRRELRALAQRFRAIGAAERSNDRRAA
jgi:hypothetical protein